MRIPFFAFLLTISINLQCQENKQIDYVDFLASWIMADESENGYLIEDIAIDYSQVSGEIRDSCNDSDGNALADFIRKKYPDIQIDLDSTGRIILKSDLEFSNGGFLKLVCISCLGRLAVNRSVGVVVKNSVIKSLNIEADEDNLAVNDFQIWDSKVEDLVVSGSNPSAIYLSDNHFGRLQLRGQFETIDISGNRFVSEMLPEHVNSFFETINYAGIRDQLQNVREFSFIGNETDTISNTMMYVGVEADVFSFTLNRIGSDITLKRSAGRDRFYLSRNSFFNRVSLNELIYSETFNEIDWEALQGRLSNARYRNEDGYNDSILNSLNIHSYKAEPDFWMSTDFVFVQPDQQSPKIFSKGDYDNLIRDYYKLYSIFKGNGNIASANSVYSEMKDIETLRYEKNYQINASLKSYFRWRLGQLLKFYTENGTDPAKAMVISFWIMLAFAVFYFFFPSEWDVSSKNQLMVNIRSALNKQEEGTGKAVLKSVLLLLLSLVNAMTLSLNSFVTLGFGTIPTKGLARYVCIVQGFVGWFLLSLFSVSLINQVLF
ncbi:MAG: hypothetical protein HRT61_12305 [Ekhidna sp.]|nr:hypothetical protein [Ekhidna sp.]